MHIQIDTKGNPLYFNFDWLYLAYKKTNYNFKACESQLVIQCSTGAASLRSTERSLCSILITLW